MKKGLLTISIVMISATSYASSAKPQDDFQYMGKLKVGDKELPSFICPLSPEHGGSAAWVIESTESVQNNLVFISGKPGLFINQGGSIPDGLHRVSVFTKDQEIEFFAYNNMSEPFLNGSGVCRISIEEVKEQSGF